jgi:hypothetical protein
MKAVSKDEGIFYTKTLQEHPELQPFLPKYYGSEERDGKRIPPTLLYGDNGERTGGS